VDRFRQIVAVGSVIASSVVVPAAAFVIRMARGDTHSPAEEAVSQWLRDFLAKIASEHK
jgi:hypothetical protein